MLMAVMMMMVTRCIRIRRRRIIDVNAFQIVHQIVNAHRRSHAQTAVGLAVDGRSSFGPRASSPLGSAGATDPAAMTEGVEVFRRTDVAHPRKYIARGIVGAPFAGRGCARGGHRGGRGGLSVGLMLLLLLLWLLQ